MKRVNKNFQSSSDADVTKLFNDLSMLVEETANVVVVVNRHDFDPFNSKIEDFLTPNPYLGHTFETHVQTLIYEQRHTRGEISIVRDKCINFICQLVYSLRRRLPQNIKILRQINTIAVDNALRTIKEPIGPLMEELGCDSDIITSAEMQFKNLPLTKWSHTKSTNKFWAEVDAFRDAGNNNPFGEISNFAKLLLSLPF